MTNRSGNEVLWIKMDSVAIGRDGHRLYLELPDPWDKHGRQATKYIEYLSYILVFLGGGVTFLQLVFSIPFALQLGITTLEIGIIIFATATIGKRVAEIRKSFQGVEINPAILDEYSRSATDIRDSRLEIEVINHRPNSVEIEGSIISSSGNVLIGNTQEANFEKETSPRGPEGPGKEVFEFQLDIADGVSYPFNDYLEVEIKVKDILPFDTSRVVSNRWLEVEVDQAGRIKWWVQ